MEDDNAETPFGTHWDQLRGHFSQTQDAFRSYALAGQTKAVGTESLPDTGWPPTPSLGKKASWQKGTGGSGWGRGAEANTLQSSPARPQSGKVSFTQSPLSFCRTPHHA